MLKQGETLAATGRIAIRDYRESDFGLLNDMLLLAAFPPGQAPTAFRLSGDPRLSQWISEFGSRSGDIGIIAEVDGVGVGAAWCRLFTSDSYIGEVGYVDDGTPCIAIAVVEEKQNVGIGTLLLQGLAQSASNQGIQALSLCVGQSNPAVRLYERIGFKQHSKSGSVLTMLKDKL